MICNLERNILSTNECCNMCGVLEVFLKRPTPPAPCTVTDNLMCDGVLTSEQCIREMEEKKETKKNISGERREEERA